MSAEIHFDDVHMCVIIIDDNGDNVIMMSMIEFSRFMLKAYLGMIIRFPIMIYRMFTFKYTYTKGDVK